MKPDDQHGQAIVRIFNQNQYAVGTGFLVAPGHVLTCAHVVLQAIWVPKAGEEAEDYYKKHPHQPEQTIFLDFPILAIDQPIEAKVVDWVPYGIETGDIAILQLLKPEPVAAQPLPLQKVDCSDVENNQHYVYGFAGNNPGERAGSYRPEYKVAGGRFQLRKFNDSDNVIIRGGFSGAPVWNNSQKFVIGMIATASEEQKTAQAISASTKVLQSVLKKINARCLHDTLIQSLNFCENDRDRSLLNSAIIETLRHCNPNDYERPWLDQLIDLSTDRAPAEGWEVEGRLVQFAMMLVQMDRIRLNTYDLLKNWVNERFPKMFPILLDRIHREMKQKQISSNTIYQHLMVVVEETERLPDQLRVLIWPVSDRDTYNPNNPSQQKVKKVLMIDDLPAWIWKLIRDVDNDPTIHLFLPRKLFGSDIEMRFCGSQIDVLGSKYKFVIRTNLKTHPYHQRYYNNWITKWQKIEAALDQQSSNLFNFVDCEQPKRNLIRQIVDINAAMLTNWHSQGSIGEIFGSIEEDDDIALPVAIWSRDKQLQNNLADLECVVKALQDRVREERSAAHESSAQDLLGHHLSLLWEDPKVLPPGMLDVDQDGMLRI